MGVHYAWEHIILYHIAKYGRLKKIIYRASGNCGAIKKINTVSLHSQERKKEGKVEKVLKEIVAEKFPNLAKDV